METTWGSPPASLSNISVHLKVKFALLLLLAGDSGWKTRVVLHFIRWMRFVELSSARLREVDDHPFSDVLTAWIENGFVSPSTEPGGRPMDAEAIEAEPARRVAFHKCLAPSPASEVMEGGELHAL